MISMLNPYVLGGTALVAATIGAGGYLYYTTTESKIDALQQQNARYEVRQEQLLTTIELNQQVYDRAIEQMEQQEARENELQVRLQIAQQYNDELIRKLRTHDLTYLSISKPGLIEKRINDGTEKVFDDIESITRD